MVVLFYGRSPARRTGLVTKDLAPVTRSAPKYLGRSCAGQAWFREGLVVY